MLSGLAIMSILTAKGYLGVIAQLVECLNGIQKVGGSIPPGSTTYLLPFKGFYNFLKVFLFWFYFGFPPKISKFDIQNSLFLTVFHGEEI